MPGMNSIFLNKSLILEGEVVNILFQINMNQDCA